MQTEELSEWNPQFIAVIRCREREREMEDRHTACLAPVPAYHNKD